MALAVPELASLRTVQPVWVLVAAAIAVQIVYPLMPEGVAHRDHRRSAWSSSSWPSVADVVRVHGARGAVLVVAVAGGGGLVAESVGVATGWPFGRYAYTGTLGPEVLGVPVVVPLAWVMMAWPALVVARTLAARRTDGDRGGRGRADRLGRLPRPADGGGRPLDVVQPVPRRCR